MNRDRGGVLERAALYLRSSKDRSDVSIDAQRRELTGLAHERSLIIVAEYLDAVESGKDENRPGFQQILREIKSASRLWDHVLVLDTSRIARRRHIALMFERECEKNGIRVIYKSLPDSDPITEMLLKSILQAMDEWHSMTSKAKGIAGMTENIQQGWRAGGRAPFGYQLEHKATGAIREGFPVTKSRLVRNEDTDIAASYLASRAMGISRSRASETSGLKLATTSLLDLERNALTYAGHTVWNRHSEKLSGGGYMGGTKYRPRSEWVITYETHEALITMDQAETILMKIGATSKKRHKAKRVYLLAGILSAPDGTLWHSDGDDNYRLGKGPRISADSIDRAVVERAILDLSEDVMAESILKHYKQLMVKDSSIESAKKLRLRASELENSMGKLATLLTQTTAPDAILRSIETMEKERNEILDELSIAESLVLEAKVLKTVNIKDIKTLLAGVVEDLADKEINQEDLKDVLATIIDSVVLNANDFTANLTYKISGESLASPRGFEPRSPP